jgi:hypothetical protein
MTRSFIYLAVASCLAAVAHAAPQAPHSARAPMTQAAYAAEKQKIAAEFQVDRKTCASVKGSVREVCDAQARGKQDAALAELEARYHPSPELELKAKTVTADANYEVAKAKCAALEGKAKDRCGKQAKLAREAAIRQAKVEKVQETGGIFRHHAAQQPRGSLPGKS